jgi:glycosyltransferase involved in cell wall biosynthesis
VLLIATSLEKSQVSSLSVCAIIKNEETYLERWLNNVHSFADEIIVVDTGSTDSSVELLGKYPTVRVETFLWDDDFSSARNFSLSLASCKWVLVLDADETMPEVNQLTQLLLLDHDAYFLPIRNFQPEDSLTLFEDSIQLRLFRNNETFRFKGRIFEEIEPSINQSNGDILHSDKPMIHHDGYRSDTVQGDASRRERNIRIITKALQEEPNNGVLYFQLGLYHKGSDPEMMERFLLMALQVGKGTIPNGISEQIHMRLAQYYLDKNINYSAIEHALKCLQYNPTNLVGYSCVIVPFLQQGKYAQALPYIDYVVANGKGVLRNWEDFVRLSEICRQQLL